MPVYCEQNEYNPERPVDFLIPHYLCSTFIISFASSFFGQLLLTMLSQVN